MSDNLTKKRLRTSGITVIISLALVLFMLGALGLLVINANKLSKHFKLDLFKDTELIRKLDKMYLQETTIKDEKRLYFWRH